jgi:hypothetical protein
MRTLQRLGRPRKLQRNIEGLRNQSTKLQDIKSQRSRAPSPEETNQAEVLDDCWFPEDLTSLYGYEEDSEREDSDGEDYEGDGSEEEENDEEPEELELELWTKEDYKKPGLTERLIKYAAAMDSDIYDEDWVPANLIKKRKRQEHEHKGV